jgi:beta-lactamase class A
MFTSEHLRRKAGINAFIVLLLGFIFSVAGRADTGSPLEGKIERYIRSLRSSGKLKSHERTAWSVYDFKSGQQIVSINENTPLQAASMIKPFLALAFFHRVEERTMLYGDTSRKHMELMIQHSDNDSTNWVMKQVGGPTAAQTLLKTHYPALCQQMKIVEYIPEGGRTYRNLASARDYSAFLQALWKGTLPGSQEILRIMSLPGRDRLYTGARSIPEGTQVFNKTGSTAMCCGDMGILNARTKNGKRSAYTVIGIIECSRPSSSYGTWISARADMIREVSNLVYEDMKVRCNLAP